MDPLPIFRYHPDPLATGSVVPSEATCDCCGAARGLAYTGPVYSEDDVGTVCPWCIADGSLADRFGATLVDDHPLAAADLPESVIEEVSTRTPGYEAWQEPSWLACCGDACEFHGDAPRDEIRALDESGLQQLAADSGFAVADLRTVLPDYEPGGSHAFYKFVCRHCRRTRYHGDCH